MPGCINWTRSAGASCSRNWRRASPTWRCASSPPAQHRFDDLALVVAQREERQSGVALRALVGELAREAAHVLVPALLPVRAVGIGVVRRLLGIAAQPVLTRKRARRQTVVR